jgi:hypothetical protein
MNHANHMVSLPVFVCAVVLTIRLFVYYSLFLCDRILFVYAVHTRGQKQFGRSKLIVLHPLFSRFWKWGICPFTSSPYAMEKMFKLIYINSI